MTHEGKRIEPGDSFSGITNTGSTPIYVGESADLRMDTDGQRLLAEAFDNLASARAEIKRLEELVSGLQIAAAEAARVADEFEERRDVEIDRLRKELARCVGANDRNKP